MDQLKHGSYRIDQYEDIVVIKFIGSMNLETYIDYSDNILAIAKEYNGRRWAEIHDYREWGLAPPEVFKRVQLDEENPEKRRFRCSDQVIITTSLLMKSMSIKNSENEAFIKPDFAMDDSEAFSILNSKGYKAKLS